MAKSKRASRHASRPKPTVKAVAAAKRKAKPAASSRGKPKSGTPADSRRGPRKGKARPAAKPVVLRDAPKPAKAPKGKGGRKGRVGEVVVQEAGSATPGRLRLKEQKLQFHPARSKARFKEENYEDFFVAEIMAELESEATIFNDRVARWRCQCCDAIIPVPRRTEVFHGDYHLVHDDVEGLLVNGEKFVPKAHTPIEVVQPGRLRNPWTGKTIEGKGQGTSGAA